MNTALEDHPIHSWLTDMDGVLVHEQAALPGAADFIAELQRLARPFLVLTNNSIFTPRDLRARLSRSGIDIPEESIWTSALATARFLAEQAPGSSAYVIGEAGLTSAMHEEGFILADADVEFVVLGETRTYSFESIARAIRLIKRGAKFIATNPDVTGPSAEGPLPATGAVAAMVTAATRISPYYIGKPNPLMMRTALNRLGAHSETSVMIGDRMDTDVKSGLEAGMRSVLVLSGSTREDEITKYPFRPTSVLSGIADVVPLVERLTPLSSQELDED
ncbi:HAD-IIA family hydrolase [Brachybacterium sp. GCM10030252]|uniref:HAD-IIA family hydrolase n=1 Tax=Brachybacterium sp. GCM10030252 TaxID=3273380 RepID=UPI00361ECFB0